MRGTVSKYSSARPKADIAFNFEAPDLSRVLTFAGATAPARLGAVTASGGVAGRAEELTLHEFTVNGMGQSLQANGTLALPGASQGTPTSATYKGGVVLNGQTIESAIDATLTGRPTVTADLRASVLDLDRLGGSGFSPRRGPPAAAQPIDTALLRSFDGSLKLTASTLISAPLRIGNADLAATLKDGVLTVSSLKGPLYGGSLNFSGVAQRQPAGARLRLQRRCGRHLSW